jgi:plastocyanin
MSGTIEHHHSGDSRYSELHLQSAGDLPVLRRLPAALFALSCMLAGACGSSDPTGPAATPADVSIVKGASLLTTTAFDPNPKTLGLGGSGQASVRWVNTDGGGGYGGGPAVTHQIASDDGAFATSGPLGAGATYTVALTTAGTYHYHCAIHPNMVGTVTVVP